MANREKRYRYASQLSGSVPLGQGEEMPTTRAVSSSFVGLRLRDELRLKLEELARREEVSLAQIIRWAVRDYLAKRWNDLKN